MLRTVACLLALAMATGAWAQVAGSAPQTGDAWLDATLVDMDRYAARYPEAFADELNRYDAAPRDLVAELLDAQHWTPGDVYFACALARVAAQPCRAVAAERTRDPAQRWDAIAQQFGVAADSPAFHRLKRGVVLSYERWARPLAVDASLHAEFPKHPLQAAPVKPVETPRAPASRAHRKTGTK
jgi:hypothetical protein